MRSTPIMITAHQCPDIIMDIDDVICNTNPVLLDLINRKVGETKSMNDFVDHDLTKIFTNITKQEIYDIIVENELFLKIEPIPNVKQALQALMDAGYNIHFCTARNHLPNAKKQTEMWFEQHNIPVHNSILYTNYGESKSKTYEKVSTCFAYMFDDGPFNIVDAIDHGSVLKPVIISQPWNNTFDYYLKTPSLYDFCIQHGLL